MASTAHGPQKKQNFLHLINISTDHHYQQHLNNL
jgi:hypothetical protein